MLWSWQQHTFLIINITRHIVQQFYEKCTRYAAQNQCARDSRPLIRIQMWVRPTWLLYNTIVNVRSFSHLYSNYSSWNTCAMMLSSQSCTFVNSRLNNTTRHVDNWKGAVLLTTEHMLYKAVMWVFSTVSSKFDVYIIWYAGERFSYLKHVKNI